MITTTKLSQRLGAAPPDFRIWDLLPGTGTPLENFLPMVLEFFPKATQAACNIRLHAKAPHLLIWSIALFLAGFVTCHGLLHLIQFMVDKWLQSHYEETQPAALVTDHRPPTFTNTRRKALKVSRIKLQLIYCLVQLKSGSRILALYLTIFNATQTWVRIFLKCPICF